MPYKLWITPHIAEAALWRDALLKQSFSESHRQHGDLRSITAGLANQALVKGIGTVLAKLSHLAFSLHTSCFCAGVRGVSAAHGGSVRGIAL